MKGLTFRKCVFDVCVRSGFADLTSERVYIRGMFCSVHLLMASFGRLVDRTLNVPVIN